MEQSLAVASSYSIPRDDRLDLATFKRGIICGFDFILTGGLDEKVRELVGLDQTPPPPVEDYMAPDLTPDESQTPQGGPNAS